VDANVLIMGLTFKEKWEDYNQTLSYKKTNERVPRKYKIKPEKEGGFLRCSI
jgi:hypothetical protein